MNTVILFKRYIRNNILAPLEHATDRINIFHVLLLSLLLAGCSIILQKGGILSAECSSFLTNHLSDRCLLNKLYDCNIFDAGNVFRSRELSYFFDFIDSKFIALSVSFGYAHFFSLTHYLFSILIGLIIWQFSVRELTLKPLMGAGIVVLFWTSPNVFLFSYFRSAKIGVALAITILFFVIYHILRKDWQSKEYRLPLTTWLLCFSIAWGATLFDEEGFFLVVTIIAFLSLWISAFPSGNILKLLLAFGASIILSLLYKYQVAPIVTFHLNHYWPHFASRQQIHLEELITQHHYVREAVILFMDTLRFLIGNIPYAALVLLGGILLLLASFIFGVETGRKNIKLFSIGITGFMMSYVLICLMIAIMVLKHPPILAPDIRRIYYLLPITPILCMTIALILSQLSKIWFISKWLLSVLMFIAIAGNIYAIPQHKAILINGGAASLYENAPRLLVALRNIKDSHYQPLPGIEKDPVYQYFRKSSGSSRK
jgi:hypothetical protein